MSLLTENIYDINDLYVIKLKDNYKDYLPDNKNKQDNEYIECFNPSFYYIVERCLIENKPSGFYEYYTECMIGKDLVYRVIENKDEKNPEIFAEVYSFPKQYFNKEELKNKKTTTSRIFQIFQEINYVNNKEENNIKKLVKNK